MTIGSRCLVKLAIVLLATSLVMGCVAMPRTENLKPTSVPVIQRIPRTVSLSVDPSITVYPDRGLGSRVPQDRYLEAVRQTLAESKLFAAISPKGEADYDLYATVFRERMIVADRVAGYVLEYDIVADWRLVSADSGESLFHEEITGRGHANVGDAFNGITRNTVARERGAQETIEEGIRKLSELSL